MARYRIDKKSHFSRLPHRVWMLLVILIILIVAGTIIARSVYNNELRPVSQNQKTQIFTVSDGSSVKLVADQLERQHLIRSSWALQLYVHTKSLTDEVQAGTYALSPSESTAQIVTTMVKGTVTSKLVTIVPRPGPCRSY
jgi:cell division protein YceG involved in septum cleavage